jgi:hypothetical protein
MRARHPCALPLAQLLLHLAGTMNARQWRRLRRRTATTADRALAALGAAGQRLAERLAYRPREVVVVALLTAGVCGGFAIERWRARHPALAAQLEAEPPRPVSAPAPLPSRSRPRSVPARCEQPGPRTGRADARPAAPAGRGRLDLNHATPQELARATGISWRVAARIVAARDALDGRDGPGPSGAEIRSTVGPPLAATAGGGDAPAEAADREPE